MVDMRHPQLGRSPYSNNSTHAFDDVLRVAYEHHVNATWEGTRTFRA